MTAIVIVFAILVEIVIVRGIGIEIGLGLGLKTEGPGVELDPCVLAQYGSLLQSHILYEIVQGRGCTVYAKSPACTLFWYVQKTGKPHTHNKITKHKNKKTNAKTKIPNDKHFS